VAATGLAIVTCSGGDSGLAADRADRLGIPLPAFSAATARALRELLPEAATVANPLDYTSMLWAESERLAAIVETAGNDPAIDQVLVLHDTPAELPAEVEPGWRRTRHGLADGAAAASAAPLFASTLPDLIGEAEITELAGRGIAAVQGLGAAMRCIAALRSRAGEPARLREIAAAAAAVKTGAGAPDARAAGDTDAEWAAAAGWLSEAEAKRLLGDAGVVVPGGRLADEAAAAAELAGTLGYPVALKLSSPAIQHKSDVGAIALGIDGPETLAEEAARMLALPQAAGARLLVERMSVQPGVELIVAVRGDAVVPALLIGIGGIWTEVLGDAAVIPLPAGAERIGAAIASLRGAPLLLGARGTEPVDLSAVATAAARIGEIAIAERLALLEVNPLIATADGCIALDAVARRIR